MAGGTHGVGQGVELVERGLGAGDEAVPRAVEDGARRREADRAGAHRRLDDRRHLRRPPSGGLLVGPLAEHVGAHGGVGHLRRHVEHARRGVERVEVLGEALPLPVDALVQRGAGDVLDALHELDEEALGALAHRGEPDAAVAHHDRGDAVPRRRCHLGIPGGLAVVVRVDVDPAWRDDESVGVELARPGAFDLSDGGHDPVVDRHVGRARRRPGAVDDRPTPDHELMCSHAPTLLDRGSGVLEAMAMLQR